MKLWIVLTFLLAVNVAPLAGAWIETNVRFLGKRKKMVAPLAGAWIETIGLLNLEQRFCQSLPSRERGLKHRLLMMYKLQSDVAPLAGAWIETAIMTNEKFYATGRSPRGSVD